MDKYELWKNAKITSNYLENIGNVLSPFSQLLDGEIIYKDIKDKDWNVFVRAENFFEKSDELVWQKDIDIFVHKINLAEQEIQHLKIKLLEDINDKPILSGLYDSYFYDIERKLNLLKSAVYSEASKWWFYLSHKDIEKYSIKTNNELDVFWSKVLENADEVKFIMDTCYKELLNEQKRDITDKRLSEDEFMVFKSYLEEISQKTNYTLMIDQIKLWDVEKSEKKDSYNSDISKETQVEIYTTMMKDEFLSNNINSYNWEIIQDNKTKKASVDQSKEKIVLPWKEKQNWLPLSDALWSYTHEIGKHVISGYNTNKYLWKWFKWPHYLETEEGLASIFTALGRWKISYVNDLPKLLEKPSTGSICILIWELYNEKNTIHLMNIYKKLIKSKLDIDDMVRRRKRFIHPDAIGSNPKDMAYTRWKNEIIYFLQSMKSSKELIKNIHELNTFKLALKDRHLIPLLKKELWILEENLMRSNFIGLYISQQLWIWLQNINKRKIKFDGLTKNITNQSYNTAQDIITILNEKSIWNILDH